MEVGCGIAGLGARGIANLNAISEFGMAIVVGAAADTDITLVGATLSGHEIIDGAALGYEIGAALTKHPIAITADDTVQSTEDTTGKQLVVLWRVKVV